MSAGGKKQGNILAFPALQRVPEPDIMLVGIARQKYDEIAQGLLHAQKLNTFTRMKCEQLAVLYGGMARRQQINQAPSTSAMETIGRLMKELQLVDESDAVAPPPGRVENRYARIGTLIRRGAEATKIR